MLSCSSEMNDIFTLRFFFLFCKLLYISYDFYGEHLWGTKLWSQNKKNPQTKKSSLKKEHFKLSSKIIYHYGKDLKEFNKMKKKPQLPVGFPHYPIEFDRELYPCYKILWDTLKTYRIQQRTISFPKGFGFCFACLGFF